MNLPHNVFTFLVLVLGFQKLLSHGVPQLSADNIKEKRSGVPPLMLTVALKLVDPDPTKRSTDNAHLNTLSRFCTAI